jgi:luciferase family oxidoreductase group 1
MAVLTGAPRAAHGMVPLSVLDLSPVVAGVSGAVSLRNSLDLATLADRLGYTRYWVAEHHNLPSIASSAPEIMIGQIAAATVRMRVGAGGVMLSNHAPLMVAERFKVLEALFPGRIDLGLGRAPGTDALTARALRRTLAGDIDAFPDDVVELMGYFRPPDDERRVRAIPGAGANVSVWILGSSLYGAELAGVLGLPYAFASHFAPGLLMEAIDVYRRCFRPSDTNARPHLMLGVNVVAADTDDRARLLLTSVQQAFVNLRSGRPTPLPAPVEGFAERLTPQQAAMLDDVLACAAVGSPETVLARLQALVARTGADELILTSQIHDHPSRLRCFEIAAGVRNQIA